MIWQFKTPERPIDISFPHVLNNSSVAAAVAQRGIHRKNFHNFANPKIFLTIVLASESAPLRQIYYLKKPDKKSHADVL
jgi:hypothetical protein